MNTDRHTPSQTRIKSVVSWGLLAALFLWGLFPAILQVEAVSENPPVLIVGDDVNYPPYSFLDDDGNPAGFNVELVRAVGAAMGYEVEIRLDEWSRTRKALEAGEIDVISGMFHSPEREELYSFSARHTITNGDIFTRQGTRVVELDDLKNQTVVVQRGDIVGEFLAGLDLNIQLVEVATVNEALLLVNTGVHDYAGILKMPGLYSIRENDWQRLTAQGLNMIPQDYAMAVAKDNEQLLLTLNGGLQVVMATGEYEQIFERWMGAYEETTLVDLMRAYQWYLLGLVLLLLGLLAAILTLRYLVKKRTRELEFATEEILKNQEKRRMSEEKLQALFASMTEMVVIHQAIYDEKQRMTNYRILDCNLAFTKVTGITREMAEGKLATEAYDTEKPPYSTEYERVLKTGKPFEFETYFPPMEKYFSVSAVSLGQDRFATISTDITENRKAQLEIAAKNKELEQIFYVASHDLRSPLVNVDGYSREMVYELEDIKNAFKHANDEEGWKRFNELMVQTLPELEEGLGYIRASVRQMDKLLNGLLKLSRLGRAALNISQLDMNDLVKRAVDAVEYQLKEAGIKVQMEDLPPCRGDEVQVTQAFSNLLDNALKYRDPAKQGIIRITGTSDNNTSTYCVEDNGIGIAKEYQERIFELFHRLNPHENEGEGLGLTTVQQIVERLGGSIYVASTPGEGSQFYIQLPLAVKGAVK